MCTPEEYGGAGLGITEAAIMMQTVAESGGAMAACTALHINVFGLHPVVMHGTPEQKQRMLPPIAAGKVKACFGVTEPNTGLNTTQLKTKAERRNDHYLVNGQKVWISTAQVADKILLLARTTPLEEVKKPTDGLSLFYTDLNRDRIAVREIENFCVDPRERRYEFNFKLPLGIGRGPHELRMALGRREFAPLAIEVA